MVDMKVRRQAADLVRRLGEGEISNVELEHNWPRDTTDVALQAIARALWVTYSDLHEHTLTGKYTLNDRGRQLLERCILFLESEEGYNWPKSGELPISGVGWPLLFLSLGLLFPLDLWIKRRNARAQLTMDARGDLEVWPFLSRSSYERTRAASRSFSSGAVES